MTQKNLSGLLTLLLLTWITALGHAHAQSTHNASWQNITQPIGTLLINPPQTALQVNQYLSSLDPNITPATYPFAGSTDVTKIQTSQMLYFVRVYNEASGSYPVGSWVMRASQARGLTPDQIRNIQALPALPTKFTLVNVPAGIIMYTGVAAPIAGWGDGGATQSKMMGPPFVPRSNYINQQLIGDCLLCYRILAPSGNAHQVGVALDRGVPQPYSSLDTLYDNLNLIYAPESAEQFRTALNALSGEAATASQNVALGMSGSFVDAIRQNTSQWLLRPNDANTTTAPNKGLWANLKGASSLLKGDSDSASVNASGVGLQLGLNRQLSPNFLAGFALGAANASFSVNERSSQGTLNAFSAAVYGIAKTDKLYLSGTLAYSFSTNGLNRDVAVNELFNQLKGSFSSQILSARLETGYLAYLGNVNVTPYAAIEPSWLWQGSFSETARGAQTQEQGVNLGLNYQGQQITSIPFSLGVQLDSTQVLNNGWTLRPSMLVAWIHELNPTRQVDASLQLLPAQSFTVYGASAPKNLGRLVLGLSGTHRSGVTSYLALEANVSERGKALGARAGLSVRF
jgi:outer membrane autotransporter protein